MIIKEFHSRRDDGVALYRSFSDKNEYIKKVGTDECYVEAIDVESARYEYAETGIAIPVEDGDRDGE